MTGPPIKVRLKLFVTGNPACSHLAIDNLRSLCESELKGNCEIEVIDVLEHPNLADTENIIATPMLVKTLPEPVRRIVGDLSDHKKVMLGLDLPVLDDHDSGGQPTSFGSGSAAGDPGGLPRLASGIDGFDQIAAGGLPEGRSTLISGPAGCGKTLMALQFLVAGVRDFGQPGVLVACEETPGDLMANVRSLGWDVAAMIDNHQLAVVDITPKPGAETIVSGAYDLSALMARIEQAIHRVGAKRVILDAIGALFLQFPDIQVVRRELHRILTGLRTLGVTTLMTIQGTGEEDGVGRFGVEESVADNIILLRNRREQESRRRTIEILKFRGARHQIGEFPFTIDADGGVIVLPPSAVPGQRRSTGQARVASGLPELDRMCGGGFYRDSIVLVSGATGTGKTLMVTEFVQAALAAGERALLFSAEESREQLARNAAVWGVDLEKAERDGLLRVVYRYPEAMGLDDHLLQMTRAMAAFQPSRVAVDSMSALARVATRKSFREFWIALSNGIRHLGVTGLFTTATPLSDAGDADAESHFSSLADTIILLRHLEVNGTVRRGLAILKMRGAGHEKNIREYRIDDNGLTILGVFRGVQGILAGSSAFADRDEPERRRGRVARAAADWR